MIGALFVSQLSFAGSLKCENSRVLRVAYHANDRFMVKLENMNRSVFICSPESEWVVPGTHRVTGPETCKLLVSMFLAAKMSGEPLQQVHFDGDDVPESCDQFEPSSVVNVRYINY